MENLIYKYKNIDIDKIIVNKDNITYDNSIFLIQSPIFNKYEIINYDSKKYLELFIDENKLSHIKFLNLIDSIEFKIKNYTKDALKTQIITNIQNKKSLKVKIVDNTTYYNSDKIAIKTLYSNNISLLFKLEFKKYYYSWIVLQILQI